MRIWGWLGLVAAGLIGIATPAAAATDGPCLGSSATIDIEQALKRKDVTVQHAWGKENIAFLPKDADTDGPVLRVSFPAGSFSPGRSEVRGGAGFELHHASQGVQSACLTYKVRFPPGFDFVKGGKLPGLFGGDDPRGCIANDQVSGFSARLMWRTGGLGELYLYAPGRDTQCGQSIGRGAWSFVPGVWTTVTQRATVNDPGSANGSVEVWIDGKPVVKADGVTLGAGPRSLIDGMLFATFFGGGDASWATPHDQSIDFADFRLTTK